MKRLALRAAGVVVAPFVLLSAAMLFIFAGLANKIDCALADEGFQ
jgi:hypothetical protein